MTANNLLPKVKAHLILSHDEDDRLLLCYIAAAVSYAESYQHFSKGYYEETPMPPTTEQAVIMLSSFFFKVGFSEPRSDGGSNAKIANILEYGKYGQPPKPFLKPARSQSKNACIETMKAKLQEEADGL